MQGRSVGWVGDWGRFWCGVRFGLRWGGSSEAEEICTYISNEDIDKIESLLDNLQIKGGEDD